MQVVHTCLSEQHKYNINNSICNCEIAWQIDARQHRRSIWRSLAKTHLTKLPDLMDKS